MNSSAARTTVQAKVSVRVLQTCLQRLKKIQGRCFHKGPGHYAQYTAVCSPLWNSKQITVYFVVSKLTCNVS